MPAQHTFGVVWRAQPEQAAKTHTARFMKAHRIDRYSDLVQRSVSDPEWFWPAVIEYLGLPFDSPWSSVRDTSRGDSWTTWFNGARFNMSRACVDRWADDEPERVALKFHKETAESGQLTFAQLRDQVSRLAGGLRKLGVSNGDAVAVYLPMSAEAVISFLAVARLGAIFVPVFSGYGPEAVAARLRNPAPKVLICADGYQRRGGAVAMKEVADQAVELTGGPMRVVMVGYGRRDQPPFNQGRDIWWHELIAGSDPAEPDPTYSEDPVMIAYTSGTTGRPKGSVHVQAGLTVKIAAEGAFQLDVHRDDVLMWATDMGWIMGPWMVIAGLANGATIATYDGVPDHPAPDRLWQVASELGLTHLGISPTLIRALQPHGAELARKHDLSRLRVFGSTGEPWNPEPWWWLFQDVGGGGVPIVNISGGTEIGACILSVNLLQGIKPTSLGGPALGVDADVYDNRGQALRGEVGELVVRGSWPAMTRGFWGEPERYIDTYWSRFPNTWVHGDWASIDPDGFWYLHGRSDDTLNVAGKRIGPAEIESAAVSLDEVVMAAAVGLPDEVKGEAIALYLVPTPGISPDDGLTKAVARRVSETLGKAFQPAVIRWVGDLPRTRSQKIMRRVVKAAVLGTDPGDLSSLENPESVEEVREAGR